MLTFSTSRRIAKHMQQIAVIISVGLCLGASSILAGTPALAATAQPSESQFTSISWAGYAATGHIFNKAAGTFVMPKITCTKPGAESLFWVGLGGYPDPTGVATIQQVGIGAKCSSAAHPKPTYFGWWEIRGVTDLVQIPANAFTLAPGNTVKASVTYGGGTAYVMSLNNLSKKLLYKSTQQCAGGVHCQRRSAEWIVERYNPKYGHYTPLAQWSKIAGTKLFNGDTASTSTNPTMYRISKFNHTNISMWDSHGNRLVATSALKSDGKSFNATWTGAL